MRDTTKPTAVYYAMLQYQPGNLARLRATFDLIELDTPDQDEPALLERTEVIFAPLGYMVGRAKIDSCPRLRVIASNTTGHPHIDVDYARQRGIEVACLKFAPDFLRSITATAELTWGLILAATRNMFAAHRSVLDGRWDRRPFGTQAMLSNMSIGIVGHGRLGTLVARYAQAFGMQSRYFDPNVPVSSEGSERMDELHELVEVSDIVTLHVPHEPQTENLINGRVFSRMQPTSWLINTSRGELICWESLLTALEHNTIAGAALDVFQNEFQPGFQRTLEQHPLIAYARTHSNLLLTPHIGGSTVDAWQMTEAHTIDMVMDALAKTTPPHPPNDN